MGYASRSNPKAVAAKNGTIQPRKPGKSKRQIEREIRAEMGKVLFGKHPEIAGVMAAMNIKPY